MMLFSNAVKPGISEQGNEHLQRAPLVEQQSQEERTRNEAKAWHQRNKEAGRPMVWKGI